MRFDHRHRRQFHHLARRITDPTRDPRHGEAIRRRHRGAPERSGGGLCVRYAAGGAGGEDPGVRRTDREERDEGDEGGVRGGERAAQGGRTRRRRDRQCRSAGRDGVWVFSSQRSDCEHRRRRRARHRVARRHGPERCSGRRFHKTGYLFSSQYLFIFCLFEFCFKRALKITIVPPSFSIPFISSPEFKCLCKFIITARKASAFIDRIPQLQIFLTYS